MQIENYTGMIYKLAWGIASTTGCSVDDLASVAFIAYYEKKDKWDSSKGIKKSTFLFIVFKNAMLMYCNKQIHISGDYELEDGTDVYEPIYYHTPERIYGFKEAIMQLSPDSRFIIELILTNPLDFFEMGKPKKSRGHVYRKLREVGWSWSRIWNSFDEIKDAIN